MMRIKGCINNFNGFLLGMILLCAWGANPIVAQHLKLNSFNELPNDLSSRIKVVNDANGIPCALVKISSIDEITRLEGNIISKDYAGNEMLAYISAGTKYIRIHTLHHSPLDIDFSTYTSDGLKSKSVYRLELKSDLSPEILFGVYGVDKPVEKESNGSILLPEWWNVRGQGMYVGYSHSSYDGENAKRAALINAIDLYCMEKGMDVIYKAQSETCDTLQWYCQIVEAKSDKFSVRILQEYYNNCGDYFVLCSINSDVNSTNRFVRRWVYEYESNKSGCIRSHIACDITLKRQPIKNTSLYLCEWDTSKVKYFEYVNDTPLWEFESDLSDCDNHLFIKDRQSLWFEQKKFLSSLPLIPDSLEIKSVSEISKTGDMEISRVNSSIEGTGKSQSRVVEFKSNGKDVVRPMIVEKFPYESQPLHGSYWECLGLDGIYSLGADLIHVIGGTESLKSPLWEITKNNAFISALSSVPFYIREYDDVSVNAPSLNLNNSAVESMNETLSTPIAVYPLWYMDTRLRNENPPKKNKDKYVSMQRSLDNRVEILIPLK